MWCQLLSLEEEDVELELQKQLEKALVAVAAAGQQGKGGGDRVKEAGGPATPRRRTTLELGHHRVQYHV